MQIRFDKHFKYLESPNYNYKFDLRTGTFYEWGATKEENPTGCPFGPTILDIEITTICNGPTCSIPGSELFGKTIPCNFCYKSNGPVGTNMSFETFKKILDKMPKDSNGHHVLTQVAIGGSACAETNPDLWKMMEYCRENKVIPNITVADINPETAEKLVGVCGAVAVSAYPAPDPNSGR